ncbi:hypothetical protein AAY473_035768 [Plecturocebus cupreus]
MATGPKGLWVPLSHCPVRSGDDCLPWPQLLPACGRSGLVCGSLYAQEMDMGVFFDHPYPTASPSIDTVSPVELLLSAETELRELLRSLEVGNHKAAQSPTVLGCEQASLCAWPFTASRSAPSANRGSVETTPRAHGCWETIRGLYRASARDSEGSTSSPLFAEV